MKMRVPHVLVILCAMVVLATLATYVIPAGGYKRIQGPEGRPMVDPQSFEFQKQQPVGLFKMLEAVPRGLTDAGMIAFTIFIIGGAWEVINATGAIVVGVRRIMERLRGHEILLIPLLMLIFGAVSAIIGAIELAIVYIPVVLPLSLALGFDSMTAAGIVLASTCAAFSATLTNPFSVGVSQQVAGLPLYSGLSYRLIVLACFMAVSIAYVMRYAARVKRDPSKSLTREEDAVRTVSGLEPVEPGSRHALVGLVLVGAFALMVYGVLKLKWFMTEIGAVFFLVAVLSAVFGGLGLSRAAEEFSKGAQGVTLAALIVGFSRAIVVVVEQGNIIDTIVWSLARCVQSLPAGVTVLGLLVAVLLLEFVVPSASGKALITMPIMVPLADIVGVTRQTAVLVYQLGDGMCNIFYPIEGGTMAVLSLAGVPYEKWFKFILPLISIWLFMGSAFLLIAQAVRWGPF
ncbi:MAG: YfcC family protein [Ignavibacteriales bacterium]